MTPLIAFLWGVFGSVAVECVTAHQASLTEPVRLPQRYRVWWFWVARVLLTFAAGGLAVALEVNNPQTAVTVGAAAPLVLQMLARGAGLPGATARSLPEGADESETLPPSGP